MLEFAPLPDYNNRDEYDCLVNNIKNCKRFFLSIAFFTDILRRDKKTHRVFIEKLRQDSFIIVDVEKPTDFEYLSLLKDQGCNIYFCKPSIDSKGDRQRLMHTKIYIFEFESEAEVWVGSMNFTQYGIKGENLECSVKMKFSLKDPKLNEIKNYVYFIRDNYSDLFPLQGNQRETLRLFNPKGKPKLYRLFGQKKEAFLLFTEDFKRQIEEEYIQLFFIHNRVENLSKNEEVFIYVYDMKTESHFCARGLITQIGDIEKKTDIDFLVPKPFTIIIDNDPGYLFNTSTFSKYKKIKQIKSFVTIKVKWLEDVKVLEMTDDIYFYPRLEINESTRCFNLESIIHQPRKLEINKKYNIFELRKRLNFLIDFFYKDENHLSNELTNVLDDIIYQTKTITLKHSVIIKDSDYKFIDLIE